MPNQTQLSWDNPTRLPWSAQLLASVAAAKAKLDAGNPEAAAPGYGTLSVDLQIKYWAELLIQTAKHESSWDPNQIYPEPPPLSVDSVGLLQLSYQDSANFAFEPISQAERSLQDPLVNLRCGVIILAKLVSQDGVVAQTVGKLHKGAARYWSTIRPNSFETDILTHARASVGL